MLPPKLDSVREGLLFHDSLVDWLKVPGLLRRSRLVASCHHLLALVGAISTRSTVWVDARVPNQVSYSLIQSFLHVTDGRVASLGKVAQTLHVGFSAVIVRRFVLWSHNVKLNLTEQ